MEIARRTFKTGREVAYAAKPRDNRRAQSRRRRSVAHQKNIRRYALSHRIGHGDKSFTSRFLLTFENDLDGRSVCGIRHKIILYAVEKCEELPLVVLCAAAIDATVDLGRRERRSLPFGKRICGLNIVVTVDQDCWSAFAPALFGVKNGRIGFAVLYFAHKKFAVETDRLKPLLEPDGAGNTFLQLSGIGPDRFKLKQFAIFFFKRIFHICNYTKIIIVVVIINRKSIPTTEDF